MHYEITNAVRQDGRGQPNPYSFYERLKRALWACTYWFVYRWVPRYFNAWHRGILRMFGARIGTGVCIHATARIECPWNLDLADYSVIAGGVRLYALGPITIGEHTVVSQRAHLCAGSHDYTDPRMPLLRPSIVIGHGVWICTEAFVGPGSTVGDGTVVGARSVVTGELPPDMVCAGNPCRPIKRRIMRSP